MLFQTERIEDRIYADLKEVCFVERFETLAVDWNFVLERKSFIHVRQTDTHTHYVLFCEGTARSVFAFVRI